MVLGEEPMECPMDGCVSNWTHLLSVTCYERPGGEDTQTVAYTVSGNGHGVTRFVSDNENPSLRRDATVLHFMCEWGHLFDLQFIQHKGQTLTAITNVRDDPELMKSPTA
jgi:hypothetical protein